VRNPQLALNDSFAANIPGMLLCENMSNYPQAEA
jgi:hypothetical protein